MKRILILPNWNFVWISSDKSAPLCVKNLQPEIWKEIHGLKLLLNVSKPLDKIPFHFVPEE